MGMRLGKKLYQSSPGYVWFKCPGCKESHQVVVDGSRGWQWNGNADLPTFTPSILVKGNRRITEEEYSRIMAGEKIDVPDIVCHSFVTDGRIQLLGDCTHELAGQTVDLPDWPSENWSD